HDLLAEPVALPLGRLDPVVELLVLVRETAQPLLLALGDLDSLAEPTVVVEQRRQNRQLGGAVLDPPSHLVANLSGLGTAHRALSPPDKIPLTARSPCRGSPH